MRCRVLPVTFQTHDGVIAEDPGENTEPSQGWRSVLPKVTAALSQLHSSLSQGSVSYKTLLMDGPPPRHIFPTAQEPRNSYQQAD